MILEDIKLSAPNALGYCDVTAVRASARADLETLRLIPGVYADQRQRKLIIPANCNGPIIIPPELPPLRAPSGRKLRKYQTETVYSIEHGAKFVALDVGCGKTDSVCCYLSRHPELRPVIVVAPLIAMGSWVGHESPALQHYDLLFFPTRTTKPDLEKVPKFVNDRPVDGYFVNYEILYYWQPYFLLQVNPKVIVVDEGHEVRNIRTRESRSVRKLCQQNSVERRLWLTATPVVGGLIDLYHQLECIEPGRWGHMVPYNDRIITSFGTRYCGAVHNGYGWQYESETNSAELRYRLSSMMIRRSRFEVRKELPPMRRDVVHVPVGALDEKAFAEYRAAAVSTLEAHATGASGARELTRLSAMANSLSWAKRQVAVDQAEQLGRGVPGHKVVVFCWYQRTAAAIAKELEKRGFCVFGPVTGQMENTVRLDAAVAFRDLPLPENGAAAYVATIGAAGQALNPLSAASAALFVDLCWVPTTLIQAEGRVHREGQRASEVLIRYLIVDDSIDTIMFKKLERKSQAMEKALGDEAGLSLCESLGGRSDEESLRAFLDDLAALPSSALGLK